MENVAAYTKPSGSYPEYISFNRTDEGDMSVTVRSAPTELPTADQSSTYTAEGTTASIVIPAAEWEKIMGV